jgi:branched-chain amino acid transport system substrate-binding protein
MDISRRTALGAASAAAIVPVFRARAQAKPVIRIGIINDQSGVYRDVNGPTSIACTRQAIQEFGAGSFDVEVLTADHQNKPDVGAAIAKQWIDQDGVDFIQDGASSAVALAISGICKEKNKVFVPTSTATSDLTGKACTPNTIHWVYDTYMEARSTGGAMVKAGGDTWFYITPNYAAGLAFQRDTTRMVESAGGKILGARLYPFPETTDFSAPLVEAKASGAKILGVSGAGSDLVNIVKQAHEFGVQKTMNIAALIAYSTDVHSIGLETAQGLRLSETYYWDLNDRTRSFQNRIKDKVTLWPNMSQAGNYSCTLHYLKAVTAMGAAAAKADGSATVARMKAIPTDDDCFGPGRIREDGRKIHPVYLFEVKKPSESTHAWDLYKLIATTPAEDGWRPLSEGACPLVKA